MADSKLIYPVTFLPSVVGDIGIAILLGEKRNEVDPM